MNDERCMTHEIQNPKSKIQNQLAASWPPDAWRDLTVLVAVSGGADSVALVRSLAAIRAPGPGRLCVAHFNHGLRGAESAGDEAFVVELCRQLGLPCEVGHAAAALADAPGATLEEAARDARYEFLRHTAERLGARYVVTAHTADDQAETVLHRVIRGSGVAGLCGIGRTRSLGPAVTVIRPLLGVRRSQLLAYLAELSQPYRDDSSNADRQFTRNRIRHELLPRLAADFNPGVVDALLRLATLAGEMQAVVDAQVNALAARCVHEDGPGAVRIERSALTAEPPYVVRELLIAVWRRQGWPLQSMGFAEWEQLAHMALSAAGSPSASAVRKRMFPGSIVAEFVSGSLRLARRSV
jgi:tRNA(Ile)-lysidine synthase